MTEVHCEDVTISVCSPMTEVPGVHIQNIDLLRLTGWSTTRDVEFRVVILICLTNKLSDECVSTSCEAVMVYRDTLKCWCVDADIILCVMTLSADRRTGLIDRPRGWVICQCSCHWEPSGQTLNTYFNPLNRSPSSDWSTRVRWCAQLQSESLVLEGCRGNRQHKWFNCDF